jgi:hypothetical protein
VKWGHCWSAVWRRHGGMSSGEPVSRAGWASWADERNVGDPAPWSGTVLRLLQNKN